MSDFENGVTLHHVGYVVESIEKSAESFLRSLAAEWDRQIIHDPLQTARVAFFTPRAPGNPVIELVEPAGEQSAVAKFLARGGGFHHLCYEVNSLDSQLAWTRANGDLIARPAAPAVAFGSRRIAWIYTKGRMLIEYLEREGSRA